MNENTYMEQYINQVILPRYLRDWLMEALKEVKDQKNAGLLKRVHELIDHVEKSGTKLYLYQKATLELLLINVEQMKQKGRNEE